MDKPIKSSNEERIIKISADTEELENKLDVLTEKANQLINLLNEAKQLIDSLNFNKLDAGKISDEFNYQIHKAFQ